MEKPYLKKRETIQGNKTPVITTTTKKKTSITRIIELLEIKGKMLYPWNKNKMLISFKAEILVILVN